LLLKKGADGHDDREAGCRHGEAEERAVRRIGEGRFTRSRSSRCWSDRALRVTALTNSGATSASIAATRSKKRRQHGFRRDRTGEQHAEYAARQRECPS
jgi:hypothetical protein